MSLIHFINLSPKLFISLSFANNFAITFFGSFFCFIKAFECAKWAGRITKASIKEIDKVSITTIETSPKNSPILPSKNKNNANAKIVVIIADTTGGITSKTPSIAAL